MIGRRELVGAAIVLPALALPASALACRAATPKDRGAYTATIDRLFGAWWRRDRAAFRRFFEHGEVEDSFDASAIFAEHFVRPTEPRFRSDILFNGSTAVVQVVAPMPADPVRGLCSGMARGDLFAIAFYPGLEIPVVERLTHVGESVLAEGEWRGANG